MNTVMLKYEGYRSTIEVPCADSSEAMSKVTEFRNNGIKDKSYEIKPLPKPINPNQAKQDNSQ